MNGHTNGVNGSASSRVLTPGIYAPIPAFFLPDTEDLGASIREGLATGQIR